MALGCSVTHRGCLSGRRQVSERWHNGARQSWHVTMSQTNWIGAFIAIGFIAYIIARGQLTGYLQVLGLQASS